MKRPKPWMKFSPDRWQRDLNLRLCGAVARGVWIELMGIMHQSERYGYLIVNGRQPTNRELSVLTALPVNEIGEGLDELEANGVFSRDEERVIYSRAMVRDEAEHIDHVLNGERGWKAKQRKLNAKTGGLSPPSSGGSSGGSSTPHSLESEKREREREESPPLGSPPAAAAAKKIELPDDWKPGEFGPDTEAHRISASWSGNERKRQVESFTAHHRAKGSRYSDWMQAWGTWVRNSETFAERRSPARTGHASASPTPFLDTLQEELAAEERAAASAK